MAQILFSNDAEFAKAYSKLISLRGDDVDIAINSAKETIDIVKANGFTALAQFSQKYDNYELNQQNFKINEAQIDAAIKNCDANVVKALEVAAQRIADFHEKSLPKDNFYEDDDGIGLGWRWGAVDSAGLYAPGGKAAYPSSVLMNAIPAKVAGVKRTIMTTPPHKLHENPAILAAAKIAGIDEIFGAGGAQAIAAMAYGAGELLPVDVIVGPGNAYVSAAKKLVFGDVGIDSIAGPSEVFIIADAQNNPAIIACDLLAQAEHDEMAQSILFTDNLDFAKAVDQAVLAQIAAGKAGIPAHNSWRDYGAIIIVENLLDSCELVNQGAPEHLEIATQDPDAILPFIRHAGSIFIGHNTPESLGDYVAGPNHVLPTGRRARFSSGLSVLNFMKRTTILRATKRGLEKIGPYASILARAEGLPAHGHSVDLRLVDFGHEE
jgi:histidinol dehydrogenase